jgi:hypothetical protein
MKANLDLTVQGVKGGKCQELQNKSLCIAHIDDSSVFNTKRIIIDAFTGQGDTFKRRENCLIDIEIEGETVFCGTFNELIKKLR